MPVGFLQQVNNKLGADYCFIPITLKPCVELLVLAAPRHIIIYLIAPFIRNKAFDTVSLHLVHLLSMFSMNGRTFVTVISTAQDN